MSTALPRVDLHTHTSYSDGVDTPWELVAKAAQHGVRDLAITDHDTTAGLPEAIQAGQAHGVNILSGIELTVQYAQYHDVHMLGYFFDPSHEALCARLQALQAHRVQRGVEILQRINVHLSAQGRVPLDRTRVLDRARGALARPHIAQELIAQGYASTVQHAFQEFLIPYDVPKATLSPEEAFDLMAQAGGVCSLAHPGTVSTDPQTLDHLLATFAAMGMVGVEAYHHCHQQECINFLCICAQRHGLVVTGGSDYHGRSPGARLGHITSEKIVPASVLPALFDAHATRRRGISP